MTFAGNTIQSDVRSIISCYALIYKTIYFIFQKPIKTITVPTIKSQTGVSAKSDATYPIYSKSLEFAIYGGMLRSIIE